jgi:3-methyladenine DNA glycosylase AlkC
MLPANINITSSSSQSQFTKENIINALQSSGLKNPEKIADAITKKLTKGTGTEKDIFEAAQEIYKFSPTSNTRLIKAIDSLNGKTDIQLLESNAKWTGTGAVIDKDEREQPNDSLNMVRSSIEKIKKINPEFTVDDIIKHLKTKNENENEASILVDGQGKVTKNKHLHDNLVAMRDQGVTREDIIKATNSDAWNKLLGTVKETEFQRVLVKDSINQIKKANPKFTVDDIIKHLKTKNENENEASILVDGQGKVMKNKHLHDNLVAMRDQGVTREDIIKATNSDAEWNKLLGTVKETEFQRVLVKDSINQIKRLQ